MGGCQTKVVSICPPYIHTPPYIWTPPYVQRVLIGYLLCYIIKCFPTLEAGMGGVRLKGCPYAPYVHTPPYIWTPPIHLASFNRVFILLFHKLFSYFRGSHGGLSDLGGIHMPLMFIYCLYVSKPPYVCTSPICLDVPYMFGCPLYV